MPSNTTITALMGLLLASSSLTAGYVVLPITNLAEPATPATPATGTGTAYLAAPSAINTRIGGPEAFTLTSPFPAAITASTDMGVVMSGVLPGADGPVGKNRIPIMGHGPVVGDPVSMTGLVHEPVVGSTGGLVTGGFVTVTTPVTTTATTATTMATGVAGLGYVSADIHRGDVVNAAALKSGGALTVDWESTPTATASATGSGSGAFSIQTSNPERPVPTFAIRKSTGNSTSNGTSNGTGNNSYTMGTATSIAENSTQTATAAARYATLIGANATTTIALAAEESGFPAGTYVAVPQGYELVNTAEKVEKVETGEKPEKKEMMREFQDELRAAEKAKNGTATEVHGMEQEQEDTTELEMVEKRGVVKHVEEFEMGLKHEGEMMVPNYRPAELQRGSGGVVRSDKKGPPGCSKIMLIKHLPWCKDLRGESI